MDKIVLNANKRDVLGKKVKHLRVEGKVPAVVYGREIEPLAIVLDQKATTKTLASTSGSTLVNLIVDGDEIAVLVREKQFGIIDRKLMHVDFQAVVLGEMIKARARVVLTGEAPAVSELMAMLISGAETVEIECLPKDLLDEVVVDVSGLDRFGAGVYVRDLEFPEGVTPLDSPDTMLALTAAPAVEEEEPDEEDELLLDITGEPEVIEKGKDEEDSEEN
ncbi:MAG: 50S ribosomal protein L25 [Chloroflexota bacterium]